MERLDGKHILLGVTGSIAAYKACEVLRELRSLGATVQVAPTRAASAFVTPLTFEALSARPVLGDVLEMQAGRIPHVEEAYAADLALIAPASADSLAKMAHGLASEALFATLLAYKGPLIVAPAMETEMWTHPATQANVETLRERGATMVGPAAGALASGRTGEGRLADVNEIVEAVFASVANQDLRGEHLLITAGPTCEDLDPVRFLTNRSSGRMGIALARAAAHRGAEVLLVHGPLHDAVPIMAGLTTQAVRSAKEMFEAVRVQTFQLAILAAAVADYTVATPQTSKIKKHSGIPTLVLEPTQDILAHLGQSRPPALDVLVGFAAETDNVLENARRKMQQKRADLICANDVSRNESGFLSRNNRITLISSHAETDLGLLSKDATADRILDVMRMLLTKKRGSSPAR